jgi:hypothetical protein
MNGLLWRGCWHRSCGINTYQSIDFFCHQTPHHHCFRHLQGFFINPLGNLHLSLLSQLHQLLFQKTLQIRVLFPDNTHINFTIAMPQAATVRSKYLIVTSFGILLHLPHRPKETFHVKVSFAENAHDPRMKASSWAIVHVTKYFYWHKSPSITRLSFHCRFRWCYPCRSRRFVGFNDLLVILIIILINITIVKEPRGQWYQSS